MGEERWVHFVGMAYPADSIIPKTIAMSTYPVYMMMKVEIVIPNLIHFEHELDSNLSHHHYHLP